MISFTRAAGADRLVLTGVAVSLIVMAIANVPIFPGCIGFVGLMVPHMVRLGVFGDNARVIPAAMLAGAVFLIRADIVARTVMRSGDILIGIPPDWSAKCSSFGGCAVRADSNRPKTRKAGPRAG
ncbi:iron chelate uptake ABC transporter family permease subunit [Mesobaculum littorinae]|uniref:iron chelate uptake ABC transporter family permease subunit n=1 Tax=Mesobaculum littorinae TaxID=2486419 RepID=UPI002E270F1F